MEELRKRYLRTYSSNRLFIDMDGTLCEFTPCREVETLYQKGYFENLNPREEFIDLIKDYIKKYGKDEVYVLTSYLSDSSFAYEEKEMWLKKYVPQIKEENYIFVPYGESKAKFAKEKLCKRDILLDDFSKNLFEWEGKGGTAIKVMNGINGTKGTWRKKRVNENPSLEELEKVMNNVDRRRKKKVHR